MTALGVEYGVQYTLTGPDGTVVTFNNSADPNFVGVLDPTECSGLDSAEVREDTSDRVEEDGDIQGNNYYGKRPIVLAGVITANSATQRNERIDKITRACNAMRKDAVLSWTPAGGVKVSIAVRRQQPLRVTKGFVKSFQIPLVSADPRIYNFFEEFQQLTFEADKIVEQQAKTAVNAGTGTEWTNPTNVFVSDNIYATCVLTAGSSSKELWVQGYTGVPTNARIRKVEARIERKSVTALGISDSLLQIVIGGVTKGQNCSTATQWPLAEETKTYTLYEDESGVNNTLELTPAMVNAANFGYMLKCKNTAGVSSQGSIDQAFIKITYEVPFRLENQGSMSTPLFFRIEGPVTPTNKLEITLRRSATNGGRSAIVVEGAGILEAGKIAEISTRDRSILINGENKYGKLNFAQTKWFDLEPGSNDIDVNTTGFCEATWRSAWA